MSLGDYLRGVRPNPEAPLVLWHRHGEGGPWAEVERLGSWESVDDWVLSPTATLDHGDLVRLLSPEGKVVHFWVQTLSGLVRTGFVEGRLGKQGWDWEAAWEGPQAEADDLLKSSVGVDRRRLVLAACDCAERSLVYIRAVERRPREAIEVARRWVRGEASPEKVAQAKDAAFAAYQSLTRPAESDAAYAAFATLRVVDGGREPDDPSDAASMGVYQGCRAASYSANDGGAEARLAARRALAPLVRRWIPLPIVLLARAGEPTPLGLLG